MDNFLVLMLSGMILWVMQGKGVGFCWCWLGYGLFEFMFDVLVDCVLIFFVGIYGNEIVLVEMLDKLLLVLYLGSLMLMW